MGEPEAKIIGPFKGKGERNIYCARYGACLVRAVSAGWMDFNCGACSIKITGNTSEVTSDIPPFTSGNMKECDMAKKNVGKEFSISLKTCAQCGQPKPLDEFRKKGSGYTANCLECIHDNQLAGYKKPKGRPRKAGTPAPAPAGSNGKLKIVVEVDIDTIVDEVTRRLSQKLAG